MQILQYLTFLQSQRLFHIAANFQIGENSHHSQSFSCAFASYFADLENNKVARDLSRAHCEDFERKKWKKMGERKGNAANSTLIETF